MQEEPEEKPVDQKDIFPIQKEKLKRKYWGLVLFFLLIVFAFGASSPFWSKGASPVDYSEITVLNPIFSVQGVSSKPNEQLRIFVNSKFEDRIASDDKKDFSFSLSLAEGENIIEVFGENDKLVLKQKVTYVVPDTSPETTELQEDEGTITENRSENSQGDQVQVKLNVTGSNNGSDQDSSVPPSGGANDTSETLIQPIIYPSKIIISYIYYSQDALSGGGDEYAIIRNTGEGEKEITGYVISDNDGNAFTFPYYVLKAGETVRVNTNKGGFSFKASDSIWDKVGEPAYLKDSQDRLIDIYSY